MSPLTTKYALTSVLYDGAGKELRRTKMTGVFGPALFAAGRLWAEARLKEIEDDDAYVEHDWAAADAA